MLRSRAALLLGTLAFAACAQGDESPTAPTSSGGGPYTTVVAGSGEWGAAAPLPLPLQLASVGSANGKLYIVSGLDDAFNYLSPALEYTPGTDSWLPVDPMPFNVFYNSLVTVGTRLYSLGGCDVFSTYDHVAYLRSTGSWGTASPMSIPRCQVAAGNIGGKIYAFGGIDANNTSYTLGEVYDPSTDHWTPVADIPIFVPGSRAEVLNGQLYVFQAEGGTAWVNIYDPGTNSWTTGTAAPDQELGYFQTAVAKGILYLFALGNNSYGYDPAYDTWTPVAAHPFFNNASAVGLGKTIYVPGGVPFGVAVDTFITFTPAFAGNRLPVVKFTAPVGGKEATALQFDAAATADPDGDPLTYAWDFGDGDNATGAAPTHTYADNGTYQVSLHVSDGVGCATIAKCTLVKNVTVLNTKPTIDPSWTGATVHGLAPYVTVSTFSDATGDTWTATVDWGEGAGTEPLALSGQTFVLFHTYGSLGVYDVTVTITDDDGGSRSGTRHVRVQP